MERALQPVSCKEVMEISMGRLLVVALLGGVGTIFKISSSGTLTTLYTFTGVNGGGGGNPVTGLVQGSNGNFYGTTSLGTVYQITPAGVLTVLYTFDTNGRSGLFSCQISGLIVGSDGNFYGTTGYGGTYNVGTVFMMTPSGAVSTLYSFTGGGVVAGSTDAAVPCGGVVQGADGSFYGTSVNGGAYGYGGYGAVFKVSVQAPLVISSPLAQSNYQLTQDNYIQTPEISFSASSADTTTPITWTLQLLYSATDGKGAINATQSFSTTSGQTHNIHYTSKGGQLSVTATQGTLTANVTLTITGEPIPDATITAQLDSLYANGATPNLLTGIAEVESSYEQFDGTETKYGYTGYWPNESKADGGSHIGLMMVPTTALEAWDWLDNTSNGASLFQQKLAAAGRNATRIIAQNPGLPNLTPVQLENMALLLYGPFAPTTHQLKNQYYIPATVGGVLTWIVNTANNPSGVTYANSCRSNVQ
ncbi:MAG: choice-of-anchor tandem repeat GloVer-containing protein [Steroidobacteraceae bacterium]